MERPKKTQQKALFGNYARNGIGKCLELTVQDDYGPTDTHNIANMMQLTARHAGRLQG